MNAFFKSLTVIVFTLAFSIVGNAQCEDMGYTLSIEPFIVHSGAYSDGVDLSGYTT
jgi:hypothetical protein